MPFNDKVLFLGDMFELGKYAEEEHQAIVNLCQTLHLDEVYLCGTDFVKTKNTYKTFATTNDCLTYIQANPIKNKNIFMKGSRGMKLESLVPALD